MSILSVIIPNYNHSKYLPECLNAILSQSLQPSEVLVVDDCSTDNSCEIVENYKKQYPHVSLIKLTRNSGGPIIPVAIGLKHVKSDYVVLCASDDLVQPGFFEESMRCAAEYPKAAICFGNCLYFPDQKTNWLPKQAAPFDGHFREFTPSEFTKLTKRNKLHIISQACLYKKEILIALGGYDEKLAGYSDYYLNYQIAFRYPIAYANRLWGSSRIVSYSYGRNLSDEAREKYCTYLLEKIENEPKEVQRAWLRSGILLNAGFIMVKQLVFTHKRWKYLPAVTLKCGVIRIAKNIIKKIIRYKPPQKSDS